MKIINSRKCTPEGILINLNPEFVDVIARDPCEAMRMIDGLEKFDKRQWREVMHLFAVSGIQHTHDSIHAGEKLQRCNGKRESNEDDKTGD